MGVREAVRPAFQLVWGTVRQNVEAMPEEGLAFTPPGLETRSFRDIAVHMANVCVTFEENIGRNEWERIITFPPDKHTAKPQVLAALAEGGERFLTGLGRLSEDEAVRVVRTPWGAEMPQAQLAAAHVPHMFYHNGQLSIYLRMKGVKPLFLAR